MKAKVSVILAALLSISLAGAVFVNQNSGSLHFQKGIDFECNDNGYSEYLSQWTAEEKNTSRDTTSDEFKQRVQYFIDNCKKIHEWNRQDKYKMEFTYYADWSAEEFEKLGSTTQRYSGTKSEMPATQPFFNNTNG